jgi:hypothetical protein
MTREGLPTGEGTAGKNDVADPHPSTEENYDLVSKPGGARTSKKLDIGPNTYAHDRKAPPVSKSKGSKPK